MNILSWNLNGLLSCIRNKSFGQLQKLPVLDVMCFQEIKTGETPQVMEGYHHFFYSAEEKKYSGTLTLTMVEPLDVIYGIGVPGLDREGRVITVDLGCFYVVNTYAPNSQGSLERRNYRLDWDRAYYEFLAKLADVKPVIACGDFNLTRVMQDVYAENERLWQQEQGYCTDERSNLDTFVRHWGPAGAFVPAFYL